MGESLDPVISTARRFVCGNVFLEAGIGAAGVKALINSNLYAGAGVAVLSLALGEFCRDEGFNPDVHVPSDPEFQGGQCPIGYSFTGTSELAGGGSGNWNGAFWGPVSGFSRRTYTQGSFGCARLQVTCHGNYSQPRSATPLTFDVPSGGTVGGCGANSLSSFTVNNPTPINGVDDCGSLPVVDPPIVGPEDPVPEPFDFPITPTDGSPSYTIPVSFVSFNFEKLLGVDGPLISFDFSGAKIDINFGTDPPTVSDPAGDIEDLLRRNVRNQDEIEDLLEAIKDCTCSGGGDLENLTLAYATCDQGEGAIETQTFQVPEGSVDQDTTTARFLQSAIAAESACVIPPFQQPMSLLLTGTTSANQRVFFSPPLAEEVVSVILELDDNLPERRNIYLLQGDQSESKYGHLDFTLETEPSASGGPFVWTKSTYFRLPSPRSSGRIRVSLQSGISFSLYDSGERIPSLNAVS